MIRQHDQNMSPCVALETARYLTDPLIISEYVDLQQGGGSLLEELMKKPKFRLFLLRLSRLTLFLIFMGSAILTINEMDCWNDIYFWLHQVF
jgi:hypothetical protein